MKWLHRIVFFAITAYVIFAAIAFFGQRKILYFPPDYYHAPPVGFAEIRTETGILGWYSPAQPHQPTVMVFHGNASSIDSNLHIFRDLRAAGYGVWSVGYPGYPGTQGTPTQKHLVAAARDQYRHLTSLGVKNIVYYGTSLGSGVATQLSAHYPPDLLILDAPFNSVADIAREIITVLPTEVLLKDKWASDKALRGSDVPFIWIHGTDDKVVPIRHGQKLYDGYAGPKSAHVMAGSNHINTWLNGGRETVLSALNNL